MEWDGSNYLFGEERLQEAFDQVPDPPADTQAPKQKRSKFSTIRRKEVAYTRKKGACIRCHLGKIKVPTLTPTQNHRLVYPGSALVNTHVRLAAKPLRGAFRNMDGCNACHSLSEMSTSMR